MCHSTLSRPRWKMQQNIQILEKCTAATIALKAAILSYVPL